MSPELLETATELIPADWNVLHPRFLAAAVADDPGTPENEFEPESAHGVAALTKDAKYRVRVLTELIDGSSNKTTVVSNYTDPVVVREETIFTWFIEIRQLTTGPLGVYS